MHEFACQYRFEHILSLLTLQSVLTSTYWMEKSKHQFTLLQSMAKKSVSQFSFEVGRELICKMKRYSFVLFESLSCRAALPFTVPVFVEMQCYWSRFSNQSTCRNNHGLNIWFSSRSLCAQNCQYTRYRRMYCSPSRCSRELWRMRRGDMRGKKGTNIFSAVADISRKSRHFRLDRLDCWCICNLHWKPKISRKNCQSVSNARISKDISIKTNFYQEIRGEHVRFHLTILMANELRAKMNDTSEEISGDAEKQQFSLHGVFCKVGFRIRAETKTGQYVAIVGNRKGDNFENLTSSWLKFLQVLGTWDHSYAFPLSGKWFALLNSSTCSEKTIGVWEGEVTLPAAVNINYRYIICEGSLLIKWESLPENRFGFCFILYQFRQGL